jgi:hypothetical protein
MEALNNSVDAPPSKPYWELLPETNSPVVIVIDNIDQCLKTRELRERLKELAEELAMASAGGTNRNFQVYVLTHHPDVANLLLEINGGVKTRLLAYGKEIVGGDDRYDSWKRKGLKLQETDVKKLVEAFVAMNGLSLDKLTQKKLIDLGVKGGTVGFIRNVFTQFRGLNDAKSRLNYLENEGNTAAEKLAKEWEACAQVERPELRKEEPLKQLV